MTQPIADVQREALAAIAAATNTANLTELDTLYLGRKAGRLTGLMRNLGTLPPNEKPAFGAALNEAKTVIEAAIATRGAELRAAERDAREQGER
ncbi:MAG: phenylalanine--tRNA ligase subunit alpha, partial [Armatimonadaceae bacterium]